MYMYYVYGICIQYILTNFTLIPFYNNKETKKCHIIIKIIKIIIKQLNKMPSNFNCDWS